MANISISVEQIGDIVSKLQTSSNEIEKLWYTINSTDITHIQQCWKGSDCDAYIEKIQELDSEIKKALKAQRLLASTFDSAKNQILDAQNRVASKASGL